MRAADEKVWGVLIVGAGFAGIGMAIALKKAGEEDFVLIERAGRVGGTWRDNTYPGITCDIPSHLYSYSFEPNPRWTRFFAPQEEILAYLEHCAKKYGIVDRIRFGTEIVGAAFDEQAGVWALKTGSGATLKARVVVSGSGHALSRPVFPDIKGRDIFAGKAMHSARWDHGYSLAGKRVAVIGTGASAIQIIPSIGGTVGAMSVFQRTPSWVMPKPDSPITPEAQAAFKARPYLQKAARSVIYWILEAMAVGYVVEPRLNRIRELHALRYLRENVADPVLREKLTPHFRLGCKRILLSNDYYQTLQQANVELVTDAIAEIRARSIVTGDGRVRDVDAIVYATGFETAEAKPPFPIAGLDGRDLGDAWRDGIEAYLGATVAGFPNMFLIVGPNTGLGHSSMVFMMESQFAYVADAVRTMKKRNLRYVDVRRDVQELYNDRLQRRLQRTVWNAGGCASWYLTRTGRNTTAWPGFTFEFRLKTRRFDVDSYVTRTRDDAAARRRAPEAHPPVMVAPPSTTSV
ncbi:MAG TPA: NAD(P)/FAD-dependent oxidoreductase [Polyangiaceae bacterium]|nr:NAD(P)/FAD-dependent oxidoreductase [Polyangiaceae bacterium]